MKFLCRQSGPNTESKEQNGLGERQREKGRAAMLGQTEGKEGGDLLCAGWRDTPSAAQGLGHLPTPTPNPVATALELCSCPCLGWEDSDPGT